MRYLSEHKELDGETNLYISWSSITLHNFNITHACMYICMDFPLARQLAIVGSYLYHAVYNYIVPE